jgi:hypothetical protein
MIPRGPNDYPHDRGRYRKPPYPATGGPHVPGLDGEQPGKVPTRIHIAMGAHFREALCGLRAVSPAGPDQVDQVGQAGLQTCLSCWIVRIVKEGEVFDTHRPLAGYLAWFT